MKFRKPFYRKDRKRWILQFDGRYINLGPDRKEAFEKYKQILLNREKAPPPPSAGGVAVVLDAFLDWLTHRVAEGTKAERTYRWYRRYIQSFVRFKGEDFAVATLDVEQLRPFHVYQWVDSHEGWTTGKRGAMTSVQRAFSWAAKAGLLVRVGGKSPLSSLEKPAPGRREQLVTESEYREILSVLTRPEAYDLVELARESGMRPHELYTFEARFFEADNGRLVFPVKLSKGKKVQRVVYLNARALEIVRRRVPLHPDGPVMRNAGGRPWNMSSTNCLFQRVRRAIGRRRLRAQGLIPPPLPRLTGSSEQKDAVKRAEHFEAVLARRRVIAKLAWDLGTKYSIYALRHAFCTEALENGIDAVTVSVLMGHRDTTMIARHYAHVGQRTEHMRQAANRARGA
jgi:integrase